MVNLRIKPVLGYDFCVFYNRPVKLAVSVRRIPLINEVIGQLCLYKPGQDRSVRHARRRHRHPARGSGRVAAWMSLSGDTFVAP